MTSFKHLWNRQLKHKKNPTSTPRALGNKEAFLRLLVLFPIVFLTLTFGGARPWIWQIVTGIFFICLGVWQFRHGFTTPEKETRNLLAIAGAFLFIPLIQVIPFPAEVSEILSPVRAQWTNGLQEFGNIYSTAFSYDTWETWMRFAWWLFLLVFAAVLFQSLYSSTYRYPTWLLHALFLLAGFQAMYGILQTLLPSLGVLWDIDPATGLAYKGYARGTFINRNHFAAFLGLLWPVLLGYLLILRSPRKMEQILGKRERAQDLMQKKAVGVFCLGLVVLGLVFSQSRGGILAAMLSSTLLFLFAGFRQKRVAMILAGCWIVMLCYGAVIGFDGIANRFSQIEQGASGRFEIWKDGWAAVQDHPLTGTGLGTYPHIGRAYQNAFSPNQRANHAHNDYLEATVEMGLPAAGLLILVIWGLWCRQAFLLWRRRETMDPDSLVLAASTLAALGGYLLHAWVEFNNAIPANQLTAVMIAVLHFYLVRKDTDNLQPEPIGHER
jgi:O-antigen ligase